MFERFTERARATIVYAQEEAKRLGHDFLGTEHLLLGLLVDGECFAARVLVAEGLTLDVVRATVERIVGVGPDGGRPMLLAIMRMEEGINYDLIADALSDPRVLRRQVITEINRLQRGA